MNENVDTIAGWSVPVDPMDLLQCESCQRVKGGKKSLDSF